MFGNMGAAIGGMFGGGNNNPQFKQKMMQPQEPQQGIGPSPGAMEGMMPQPMDQQPMEKMGEPPPMQPPMMQGGQASMQPPGVSGNFGMPLGKFQPGMGKPAMGGLGPSMGAMQGMMQRPPMRPPMSGGMGSSGGGWGNRGIQGPQQRQSMVRPGMAGSSYGGYR